jgi:hypothetical protein
MIRKMPRIFYSIVVLGLLFAANGWAAPDGEYYIPPPLTPQLSSDGNALSYGVPLGIVVDRPKPPGERRHIPPRVDLLSLPELATATFSITYIPAGGSDPWGESCTAFPEEAKAAFNAAAAIWGNILQSSVPITINACWASLSSTSTLGYSGGGYIYRDFPGATRANTWYGSSLANALAGSDRDATKFDMNITYNSNFSWYYGTDAMPPSTKHDLMSVVLHEIAHGLNFSGSMSYSGGTGSWGNSGYPNIYDTFIRDGLGNLLIDTTVYANSSTALGTALTSNNIWFHGSNAMAANGGQRVKMYAPSEWAGGSSYSHLDYTTFNNTANQLMVYAISAGEAIHDPGPVATGLLKDLGWPMGASPVNGVCGSSNGQTFTTAPTTNLCSAGTATTVSGSGPWTWSCTGSNGGTTANCSANKSGGSPVNGVCGSANGQTFSTAPTTNLCSSGTATTVSGSGPWTWSCTGSNGGTTASCSANKAGAHTTFTTGAYGNNARMTDTLSIPGATSLRVTVTGDTEANFDFLYIYDSVNVLLRTYSGMGIHEIFTVTGSSINILFTSDNSVTASGVTVTITSVSTGTNGVCGSANGQTFSTAPTTNLCSAGTPTAVSGSGPWTWSCLGLNGGTTASCSANKAAGTPGIRVISPNGGETWITGSTHAVTWASSNLNPASAVYVYYRYNNAWQQIAGPLSTSVTSFSWTVPNTPTTSFIWVGNWVNNAWEFSDQSDQSFTISQTQPGTSAILYFPHIDANLPWRTEIAIVSTSPDQTVTGTLSAYSNDGDLTGAKEIVLLPHGRRQIIVADEFANPATIGYMIFEANSGAVHGYMKFYIDGAYRAAMPAVKEVNTGDIYITHIDSSAQWWTGVSLLNTTGATKNMTITFNNGVSVPYTLNARQHKTFTIGGLLNQHSQPTIQSAVITNASGVIGLELFGNNGGSDHLDGILLTDKTVSTIYYPHIDSNGWWTGIVAYNPAASASTITIAPYSTEGTSLATSNLSIPGQGKYVGTVQQLGLPAQTAWFRIDSARPITGFELFGTTNGNQIAAYAESGGTGASAGVFPKIERTWIGWTGIAFVNTESGAATVTLTAYDDNGTVVATRVLTVGGHAKVVNLAETLFTQDISNATYIAYSADRNVVGFQLNGSSDGMMLDGLPGLPATN